MTLEEQIRDFMSDYEMVTGDSGERSVAEEEYTIHSALRRLEKLKGREYVEKFCEDLPMLF